MPRTTQSLMRSTGIQSSPSMGMNGLLSPCRCSSVHVNDSCFIRSIERMYVPYEFGMARYGAMGTCCILHL
eukprot:9243577-Pyramimonas_sp.AAC.2